MILSHRDMAVAYGGSREASRFESALNGPMREMLPADEVGPILAWIHGAAVGARVCAGLRRFLGRLPATFVHKLRVQ